MKLPRINEHQEQANFFEEVRYHYQHNETFFDDILFAVVNGAWFGGQNKYGLYEKYRKEGFKKGVADVLYLQGRGKYNCLAIEMKAQDRRNRADAVTPEQAKFLDSVNRAGGLAVVCYGAEEAISVFSKYMDEPPNCPNFLPSFEYKDFLSIEL